ncbi:hypothetical protein [Streptomyces sp. NPDC057702]|uniref:hypothetical protein n=1 Tax=unclassified Streptomyces TaxID=2593676 RepID=UPI0036CD29E2
MSPGMPQPVVAAPGMGTVQQSLPQMSQAERAWVAGYKPGDPWQATLCLQSPQGIMTFPLTPNTLPDLLDELMQVAQEQLGVDLGPDEEPAEADEEAQPAPAARPAGTEGNRWTRLSGWATVHDLWEREDPTARIIMFVGVAALVLLGVILA